MRAIVTLIYFALNLLGLGELPWLFNLACFHILHICALSFLLDYNFSWNSLWVKSSNTWCFWKRQCLTMQPRLVSNSWSSCLPFWSAEIAGICHPLPAQLSQSIPGNLFTKEFASQSYIKQILCLKDYCGSCSQLSSQNSSNEGVLCRKWHYSEFTFS